MVLAVSLQLLAALVWVGCGFLMAGWSGAGMALAVPLFLVGAQLERRG